MFDLLAYLVRHAGRVVSKQELMEHLWPDVHVSEASLPTHALGIAGKDGRVTRIFGPG